MEPGSEGLLGNLAVLPDCMLSYVLSLLDAKSLARIACVCRALRVWACEEALWQALALADYEGPFLYHANWRQTALRLLRDAQPDEHALQRAALRPPPLPSLQSLFLYKRWYRAHVDVRGMVPPGDMLPRVDGSSLSPQQFLEQYDMPARPVLLQGLMCDWPLMRWSKEQLLQQVGDTLFKVSKPTGGRMLMSLPSYYAYLARQVDEEPLYVFDATFGESTPQLLQAYSVPACFGQDYYAALGARRPDYRWLVTGPGRSGASWHTDPQLTSAWNSLAWGRKRWALYPPHVVPPGVDLQLEPPGEDGGGGWAHVESLTPLQWYLEVYPTLPEDMRPIEFVQQPGETVYVPGGWWHQVLNLEDSLAVTQNYVSDANLERVVRYSARGKAHYWSNMEQYYSEEARAAMGMEDESSKEDSEDWEEEEGEKAGRGARRGGRQQRGRGRGGRGGRGAAAARSKRQQAQQQAQQQANGTAAAKRKKLPAVLAQLSLGPHKQQQEQQQEQEQQQQQQQQQEPDGIALFQAGCGLAAEDLGCWLAGLWQAQPALQPALRRLCAQELGTSAWAALLQQACQQAGIRAPLHQELLPTAGSSGLVFCVADTAIKIICDFDQAEVVDCAAPASSAAVLVGAAAAGAAAAAGDRSSTANGKVAGGTAAASSTPVATSSGPAAAGDGGMQLAEVLHAVEVAAGQVIRQLAPAEVQEACVLCSAWGTAQHTLPAVSGEHSTAGDAQAPGAACKVNNASSNGGCVSNGTTSNGSSRSSGSSKQLVFPYTVMPRVQGWHALRALLPGMALPPRLQVARQLGELLAQLHSSCGLRRHEGRQAQHRGSTTSSTSSSGGAQPPLRLQLAGRPFWHDRTGKLWLSGSTDSSSSSSTSSSSRSTDSSEVTACWQPFVSFLRHRRRPESLEQLVEEGSLPEWLLEQVGAFLPQDPAALLGLQGGGQHAGQVAAPCFLHGDVTGGNVLLRLDQQGAEAGSSSADVNQQQQVGVGEQEQQQEAGVPLRLLDFADAGYGDPLWDLIALAPACLDSDPALLQELWRSYRLHCDVAKVWPGRGGLPLSYVALCYSLLHEEGLLERAYDARPELWAVKGLSELQMAMWGPLDEA